MGAGRGAQEGVRGHAGRRRQAAAARGCSGRVGVRGRRGAGELGVRGRRGVGALGVSGRGGVGVRGVGRGLGAWAGQDCALGAPDLIFKPVFDSIFFPSQ